LLWLKTHRSDDWQRARAVLQPKDYVAYKLTGAIVTDVSSAYALAHPSPPRYEQDYLDVLSISPELMPPLSPAHGIAGRVTSAASLITGLTAGTPVIIGTIDAFCDLLGSGAVLPGSAVDVAGTSEMIALATATPAPGEGVFPSSLDGEINFLCGPTQAGGDALRWLARAFFADLGPAVDFNAMEREAGACPPGSEGLLFLPYLEGERAPIWDPQARGAFIGLTLAHGRPHCTRAVYEGVAFSVRHVLERCETAAGQLARQVHVCGGGAASGFWNQVKADVLNRPVVVTRTEAACLGAAALASTGLGLHSDMAAAALALAPVRQTYLPNPVAAARYEQAFAVYRTLYPALRPAYAQLAALATER
jgi:xylulokinase